MKKTSSTRRIPHRVGLLFILLSLSAGLSGLIILNPLEFFFLDLKFVFAQKTYTDYTISEHVVIILFDEKSSRELAVDIEGRGWRQHLPALISTLTAEKAAWITFDIEFSELADMAPAGEGAGTAGQSEANVLAELVASFERAGNVIAGEITENSVPEKLKRSLYGLGNLHVVQLGGSPRKVKLFPAASKLPAFSLLVAGAYLSSSEVKRRVGQRRSIPEQARLLDETALPLPEEIWVNFKYPRQYFPVFSLVDVLKSQNRRLVNPEKTPLSIFKDKIVLIAKDLDRFTLPTTFGQKIFGGMFQALAIETIIQNAALVRPPWFMSVLYLLAALLIFYLLYYFTPAKLQIAACLAAYPVYLAIRYGLFLAFNLWLNFASFLIGSLVLWGLDRLYQKKQLVKNLQVLEQQFTQLEEQSARLMEAGELKQDITDTLVHDIKNSVAAVEGMINFLGQKYENDKQTLKNLNAAFVACTDIMNLSSNLLDTSRMETGLMRLEKRACRFSDIEQMIDKFLALQLAGHKQLQVEIVKPAADFTLELDHYLFERLVHNILNNAVKYTPPAGKIKIEVLEPDGRVQLAFFNSGEPIPAAWQNRIFEKYGQAGEKRSKYSKGLGLFFCKQVMQLHGGDIRVESSAEGNTFVVEFATG